VLCLPSSYVFCLEAPFQATYASRSVGRSHKTAVMNVGIRNVRKREGRVGIVVVHPDMVGIG
jgi:hypothetical protein